MAKRGQKIAAKFVRNDDGYSSDSDESSASFMAVPKEFRPTEPVLPERKRAVPNNTIFSTNGDLQNSLYRAKMKHETPKGAHSKHVFQWGHRPNTQRVTEYEFKPRKLEYCIINNASAQDVLNEPNVQEKKKEPFLTPRHEDCKKGKISKAEKNSVKKNGYRKKDYFSHKNLHSEPEDRNIIWRSSLFLNTEEPLLKYKANTQKLENVMEQGRQEKISNIEWSVKNAKDNANTYDEKPEDCKLKKERKFQYQIKNNEHSLQNNNLFVKEKKPQNNNGFNFRVNKNISKINGRKLEERCCSREKSESVTLSTFGTEGRKNMYKEHMQNKDCLLKKKSPNHSNLPDNKNSIMNFGMEISDLIVGCHLAFSTLHSIYQEWKNIRNKLIVHFEQLNGTAEASRKKSSSYQELLSHCSQLASLLAIVPDPRAQLVSKLGTVMTGFFKAVFARPEETDPDVLDINQLLTKDKQLSDALKMYGLQCDMQFRETRTKIEEFHGVLMMNDFRECNKYPDILKFLNEVKLYTPKHHTFYRKMHQCFQELLRKGSSNTARSKQFCEPFFLYEQNAVDIIKYLNWSLVEIHGSNVENELQDIRDLIQINSSPVNLKTIVLKIQNCVLELNHELESVKKCIETIHIFNDW